RIACDLLRLVSAAGRSHAQLAAENLFLKKQLALYVERQVRLRRADDATRIALVALSCLIDWRRLLTVVKPDTLIRWHRKGFQLFWRWKSRPPGRPRLPADLQRLIADMAAANRTWAEERIASESECVLRTADRHDSSRVSGLGNSTQRAARPSGTRGAGRSLQPRTPACEFGTWHPRSAGRGDARERPRPSPAGRLSSRREA